MNSTQTETYSLFLLDLVISLVDTVEIFKMQFHQPVYLLVVILDELVDQPLPLNAFAVLHEGSNN